jgi:hypothetical protein
MDTVIHVSIQVQSLDELREELLRRFGPILAVPEVSLPANVVAPAIDAPVADTYVSDVKPEPVEVEKPKRTRKVKDAPAGEPAGAPAAPTEASSTADAGAEPAAPASETDAPMTAAQAEAWASGGGKAVVATLEAGPNTLTFSREEVIDAARAFIAGHKAGKEKGNAVIKGIVASMGFARVSELPDDRMQEFLQLMDEA